MLGFNNDKKLVKRPDNEPKFNPKNKTDSKIALFIVLSCSLLLVLIAMAFLLYFLVIKGA